jgi:hypothetical protein
MITWLGRLRFRTYNPSKHVKYGILIRMMYEATTGYIGNMEIYTVEDKKLEGTTFSALEPYLDLWQHICQDVPYNTVGIAEKLLLKKTRVCGTIRANREIQKSLALL